MNNQRESRSYLFAGPGEMHRLISEYDWSATPIGPVETWPKSLNSLVKMMLATQYPMILLWGPHFIQFYNDAYSRLIGNKHPAALGSDIRITMAEGWNTLGPMIGEVMSTGAANWTPSLLLVLERSGYREESYFSVSHAPAEDDSGRIVGMFGVCSEVTQQIIGERRLRLLGNLAFKVSDEIRGVENSCRDFAATISNYPLDVPFALIYLTEPDGRTLTLRAKVGLEENLTAGPVSIDLEKNGDDVWPLTRAIAGETVLVEKVERYAAVRGGPWNEPVRSALVMPIASSGNKPTLGVFVAGISPNRALDADYRSFYELLAGQVSLAVRNARAYEVEHRRAETLAELDREKTAFFNNVSHEFRTPLTLMLGPVEELLSRSDRTISPAAREQLTIIYRNSLRLLKLVNSLLDFSRIEAGRVRAVYESVDIADFTAELASVFRAAIERVGLRLVVDCPPLPEPVYVDKEMWEKIVFNLLSNALKFTLEGEIRLEIRKSGQMVEMVVSDTGTGIPQQELPRVFERFHRVKDARGRTHEGTGIGLALVKELVKMHGGSIRLESAVGQGSTFIVSIPFGREHLSAEQIVTTRTPTHAGSVAGPYIEEALRLSETVLKKEDENEDKINVRSFPGTLVDRSVRPLILFADDNADMRDYVSRLLKERFEVVAVGDGDEALAAARERPPDLVLTDVMMPKLDGFGLLEQLRADPQTSTIPIILLSARAGEESRVEGLEAGADDYLIKPFSSRELLARVKTNLELSRLRRDTARREQELRDEAKAAQERAQILESITDGFVAFDRDWHFTYINAEAEWIIGKRRIDLIGKYLWEEFTVIRGTKTEIELRRAATEQVPIIFESDFRSANRWLEIRAYPTKDGGLSIYFRDITGQKRAEQEREELLTREQAARIKAEEASRFKDEFLATVSHELRTPMTSILGWAQMLHTGKLDKATSELAIETINRNAKEEARIIDDLLNISRIITGNLKLNIHQIELAPLIDRTIDGLRPAAQAKNINLHTTLDRTAGPVLGDPDRLQQVFWNLISNAVKYTPQGGQVYIALTSAGPIVEITVKDTGQGIDPEFLPYVFDRFRQADSSITRKYGGLGLGLALARYFVELHGGTVQADSPGRGRGATFTVRLPIHKEQPKKNDLSKSITYRQPNKY
jgi:PAS domain S-box-containing protein